MPAIAEDSGLVVDALDGAPGVESARFAGADTPYPEKFRRLYAMLDERGSRESAARFVCALAVASEGRIVVRGARHGRRHASRPNLAATTASDTTRSSSTRPKAGRWARSPTT